VAGALDTDAPAQRSPGPLHRRPPSGSRRALRTIQIVAYVTFTLEFLVFAWWSWVLYNRFSLTNDWAGNDQAWYLIAHGHLDPFVSAWGERYLSDHAALIVWLLAPLYWIWPHGVTLLWAQDLAVVVGQVVAFTWICEVAADFPKQHPPAMAGKVSALAAKAPNAGPVGAAALGLVLLVANPWIFNGISFDVHTAVFGASFAILTAYDLAHHNRRFWLWALLVITAGDVATTYLVGIVISALLAGKAWRRDGLLLGTAGLAAFGLVQFSGLTSGDELSFFVQIARPRSATSAAQTTPGFGTLLKSMLLHPYRYLAALGSHWLSMIGLLWPSGGIGVFCAWGFGVPLVVVIENCLVSGVVLTDNTFQSIVLYLFVALGTVMVITQLGRWRRMVAAVLGMVVFASALGWAIVWFPRIPHTWLRVSPSAAATLRAAVNEIPPSDQVVIEQGTVGAFAERSNLTLLTGSSSSVNSHHVWFIIAPQQGIQVAPINESLSYLRQLVDVLHAKLVLHSGGVWVFEWTRTPGVQIVTFPTSCSQALGWALPTQIGTPLIKGPPNGWGMESSLAAGYVIDGDYARLPEGTYDAAVNLTSNGPVSIQVWGADRGTLVAQRQIPSATGPGVVDVPFRTPSAIASPSTSGVGPFRIVPIAPPPHDRIEVRVFSPGGSRVLVTSIAINTESSSVPSEIVPYQGPC
jgi:hypothetical protein